MKWKLSNKKRKISRSQKIGLIALIIIIFFVSLSFILKNERKLTFVEKAMKDSTLFINKMIVKPFTSLLNSNDKKIKSLEESIRLENISEIDNLKSEINELKKSLDLNSLTSDYEIINATIINRNIGYWYDEVIIDKGSKVGIKRNDAVMVSGGLIGKVINVTRGSSTVKLLTKSDTNNKVSVQIKVGEEYVYGILTSFDRNSGYYIVEGVSETDKIEVGAIVSTTGMGDIFPSGILIGKVVSLDKNNFEIDTIIKVEPSVNIDSFKYVKVLRRKS